jgi:N-dimethylarginine dimethylaminohydrolase
LCKFGVTIVSPVAQPGAFCQIFTRDACFVIGETLFVGSLRDKYRHPEREGLADIRRRVRSVAELSGCGALIEGGDVVVLGKHVLVGMNRHTNEAGYRNLRERLKGSGVRSIRVRHRALHLDCCLAPLPNGAALYAPGKLSTGSLHRLKSLFRRLIPLDRDEATLRLAANLLWLDRRTVVSHVAAPKTNRLLCSLGYTVHAQDFSDLVSLWGSFRCVTCPIVRR